MTSTVATPPRIRSHDAWMSFQSSRHRCSCAFMSSNSEGAIVSAAAYPESSNESSSRAPIASSSLTPSSELHSPKSPASAAAIISARCVSACAGFTHA